MGLYEASRHQQPARPRGHKDGWLGWLAVGSVLGAKQRDLRAYEYSASRYEYSTSTRSRFPDAIVAYASR